VIDTGSLLIEAFGLLEEIANEPDSISHNKLPWKYSTIKIEDANEHQIAIFDNTIDPIFVCRAVNNFYDLIRVADTFLTAYRGADIFYGITKEKLTEILKKSKGLE